jgi:hypothetical protein
LAGGASSLPKMVHDRSRFLCDNKRRGTFSKMQTRIEIAFVGPDAPSGGGVQVYGPPASLSKISILNGFARDFAIREADGAFSLKWVPKGAARYGVDRAKHRLGGDRVLFLHARQPYEVEFCDRSGTESFCVFFSQQVFQKALADRLDDPALQKLVRSGDICDPLQFADMVSATDRTRDSFATTPALCW